MKKWTAILLTAVLLLSLCACGAEDPKPGEHASSAAKNTEPAQEETAPLSLSYWNNRPELDAPLREAARLYREQTGVEVQVHSVAAEEYEQALSQALAGKEDVPGVFVLGLTSSEDLRSYALNLRGSALAAESLGEDYCLPGPDGALLGVGFHYDSYGLIVNTKLLEQAGYTLEEVWGYDGLWKAANSIHTHAQELQFDAFTASGLWDETVLRLTGLLANIPLYYEFRDSGVQNTPAAIEGSYLPRFRALWDLMIDDAQADPVLLTNYDDADAQTLFAEEKAVFYLQGSWAYASLAETMDPSTLAMIPLCCDIPGEAGSGLSSGCRAYWAVNAAAPVEIQQAALDFLSWLASSQEGLSALSQALDALPFRQAPEPTNPFCAKAAWMEANGYRNIAWSFRLAPRTQRWQKALGASLALYSMDPSDARWEEVRAAFVDGWALQYALLGA